MMRRMRVLGMVVLAMGVMAMLTQGLETGGERGDKMWKLVEERVLVMDGRDRVVGREVRRVRVGRDAPPPPPLPQAPLNTSEAVRRVAAAQFPPGSPNLTVSEPWVKKGDLCDVGHGTDDVLAVHHLQDAVYAGGNDVCSLKPGVYTWTLTADWQLSFGRFLNGLEWGTKHANLALGRACYVAGELLVPPPSNASREAVFWNLLSGTYSLPISSQQSPPDDPTRYLEKVLYPAMRAVWDAVPCGKRLHYQGSEFFPEAVPSEGYVALLCASNYYAAYQGALSWSAPPHNGSSVCPDWGRKTCLIRSFPFSTSITE